MNARLLVDAVVRQTTVLIAQIATSQGLRAPLAHLANQVFYDLSRELDAQGVSRKVSADMFGMALRAYLRKIQRLNESATMRGRSLWEAVYEYLQARQVVARADVIFAFAQDDEASVRAVLHDLVESGLVFASGSSTSTLYQVADPDVVGQLHGTPEAEIDELLWALINVEGPITRAALSRFGGVPAEKLDAALERLTESHRVEKSGSGDSALFRSPRFYVPLGSGAGWEGSVFDHFSALVQTVCSKLQQKPAADETDRVGGSTYRFLVWDGHPLAEEAAGFLPRFRRELSELRDRIENYNASHERPARFRRVVVYGGQCVTEDGEEAEGL